jgi:hypothetical protein
MTVTDMALRVMKMSAAELIEVISDHYLANGLPSAECVRLIRLHALSVGRTNERRDSNPFHNNSLEALAWDEGWIDGHAESFPDERSDLFCC